MDGTLNHRHGFAPVSASRAHPQRPPHQTTKTSTSPWKFGDENAVLLPALAHRNACSPVAGVNPDSPTDAIVNRLAANQQYTRTKIYNRGGNASGQVTKHEIKPPRSLTCPLCVPPSFPGCSPCQADWRFQFWNFRDSLAKRRGMYISLSRRATARGPFYRVSPHARLRLNPGTRFPDDTHTHSRE